MQKYYRMTESERLDWVNKIKRLVTKISNSSGHVNDHEHAIRTFANDVSMHMQFAFDAGFDIGQTEKVKNSDLLELIKDRID